LGGLNFIKGRRQQVKEEAPRKRGSQVEKKTASNDYLTVKTNGGEGCA